MSVVGPILAATEGDAIDGNRRLVQFHKSIMRIVIMDKLAKLSLFERVYNWIGSDSTDGVDALIKTFYQFAGSIEPRAETGKTSAAQSMSKAVRA